MDCQEDLNYEISFYEDILKDNPSQINVLVALGDAYTKTGRYRDGLKIDKKLAELKPADPVVYYNLACSYSLLKMPDLSFEALKKAIGFGYRDFIYMQQDPDLEFIRKDIRYYELLSACADNV